jgi:hypothetical protein
MGARRHRQGARLRLVALAACAVGASSCGAASPSPPPTSDGEFVAFGPDFQGFETWPSQKLDFPSVTGSPHAAGPRTVFINHMPAPGATAFPVGTIIIKRTEEDGKLLARAKRGGDYNASGAIGWEWFELTPTTGGPVVIKWRGYGPPLGEAYGGDPKAGCNGCHKLAASNDYVLTPGLFLGDGGVDDGGAADDGASDAGTNQAGADGATESEADGGSTD